jgi:ABC-2 type transport system permease protein
MCAPDLFGGDARILDRGYRGYDGPRTGERGAIWALVRHSVQRGVGLRRTVWAKLLPIATIVIAYIPAIVFIGIVALVPERRLTDFVLPTYGEYYGNVITAIMLFVAFAAPEMLCTDRRSGMLGVYLSSPLNRDTYLLGKAIAVAGVLSLVCMGPPLLLLVANLLQSKGPQGGDIATTTLRVLGAGLALTLLYTGVTMGIASLTDRKAMASATIIMVFLFSVTVTGIFHGAGAGDGVFVGSITTLSLEIGPRVHGEQSEVMPGAPSVLVWAGWAAWTIGGFAIARYRIRKLPVTR